MDRFFATPVDATYNLRLTARPRTGGSMPVDRPVTASASSVLAGDLTVAADAAVDGDPATAWLAEPIDDRPTLRLRWGQRRTIDRVRLVAPTAPLSARPRQVVLRTRSGSTTAPVDADGWIRFPKLTTDRLDIAVTAFDRAVADPRGNAWPAPVGVAEVEVPALADLLRPAGAGTPVAVPCGSGPTVTLDGVGYPTAVSGTLADLRAGRSLAVTVCDDFASEGCSSPRANTACARCRRPRSSWTRQRSCRTGPARRRRRGRAT